MNNAILTIRTPGKLMLAGEWNILEAGHTCISLAVNRFITVTLREASTWRLTSSLLPGQNIFFVWNLISGITTTNPLAIATHTLCKPSFAAITHALSYLAEHGIPITPAWLHIDSSDFYQNGAEKFGFGSSAAVSVALIKAIITQHAPTLNTPEVIFKLAYLAHYQAQGNCGSGFDSATASLGAAIVYQSPDSQWIIDQRNNNCVSLSSLITRPWPGLLLKPCTLPATFFVNIGYSGTSAHTPTLITAMMNYKKTNAIAYATFMAALEKIVQTMITKLATDDVLGVMDLIHEYRQLMRTLSAAARVELETASLTKLIEMAESSGAAAKFSGAGGGDCCIAISNTKDCYNLVEKTWNKAGFKTNNTKIQIIK